MTKVEQAVLDLFRALPYAGFGICMTCGDPWYCRGRNLSSKVCITCFEFEHDCQAPNYKRRRRAA